MDVTNVKRIEAPRGVTAGVEAWVEPVVIPTYPVMAPDLNPMFLEKRVYQGSSGKVYPLPFVDKVSHEKIDRVYEAVHIENEYLYVMILPELGGRIHIAVDKTNDYDFIYRQNVIKPALVGLAGPWISGGIEINWPQHHRPSTFMPCSYSIERDQRGSCTVWLSEHEPMNRMAGWHGVRLSPGCARLELIGRVYNRTPLTQTFLWWANVAVRVNDQYQSFFPPDVKCVADHARRAVTDFPRCSGTYYGVDYSPGTGLDWYKNIPVPTSYMVMRSEFDFFGGYDHRKSAGFVHVADHHVAPGKKQWTWGNHPFGWAWDRNLTDDDGPYVELMAGVYTDNQPDFSFLMPYEGRVFTQCWYPIQQIGPAVNASRFAALSVRAEGRSLKVGVSPALPYQRARVSVEFRGEQRRRSASFAPGVPWVGEFRFKEPVVVEDLFVSVTSSEGSALVSFNGHQGEQDFEPQAAVEPPLPSEIESAEELYLAGLHLSQYRHATRRPESYWLEGLRRDALDSRCNTAMADLYLRRGEYEKAEVHARRAIDRLTQRNPNPRDGEPYYLLGYALERRRLFKDARAAYEKAAWNGAWAAPAHYRMACLAGRDGNWHRAAVHAQRSLDKEALNWNARALLAAARRQNDAMEEAFAIATAKASLHVCDHWTLFEVACAAPEDEKEAWWGHLAHILRRDPQNYLDLIICLIEAGLHLELAFLLHMNVFAGQSDDHPMLHYASAYVSRLAGVEESANEALARAASAPAGCCFPSRLEEIDFLESAIEANPNDAKAPAYLGNLLYDKCRYEDAIACWERSVAVDPDYSVPWRNLGIAYYNVRHDAEAAVRAYALAMEANPHDSRLLYESDQLAKRLGVPNEERLALLCNRSDLVSERDDLSLELCLILTASGSPEQAVELMSGRYFAPWEGGEGVALASWTKAQLALGRRALDEGRTSEALGHFEEAESPPQNLGEARHLLANASDVWYWLGEAHEACGFRDESLYWWEQAAQFKGDFQDMEVRSYSEMTHYQALSLRRLGRLGEAESLLAGLHRYAIELESKSANIDYFATSLPRMLLFEDDIQARQTATALVMQVQALAGLGRQVEALECLTRLRCIDANHEMVPELEDLLRSR